MTKRTHTNAEASFLKELFCDLVAGGEMPAAAARKMNLSWRTLASWKREDPQFVRDLADAERHLADVLADAAVHAHDLVVNANAAKVAQRGWQWAAEKLSPDRYGERLEISDKTKPGELVAIMRAAQERLALLHYGQVIEGTATPALPRTERADRERWQETPQERHRP